MAPDVSTEALMPAMSMDTFFATMDSKSEAEVQAGREDGARSDVAVQELLRSWEAEQHATDSTVLAGGQGNWQVCCASHAPCCNKMDRDLPEAFQLVYLPMLELHHLDAQHCR